MFRGKLMKKINSREARKIMEQLLQEGMDESKMCPKQLEQVLSQHHNIYLKYITIRDNRK